jgi:GNAT superfamily N-acetyltransferase
LADLVRLNCRGVNTWRHYDNEARPHAPAEWNDLSRWERWQHGGPWFDPKLLALHLQVMKESSSAVLIAQDSEIPVGELELVFDFDNPEDRRAHIARLVVDPSHRGQDVEGLLLRQARRLARNRGCNRISVFPEDEVAQTSYESRRFRAFGGIAELTKQLVKSPNHESSDSVHALRLTWDSRPHPPQGFKMIIGNTSSPRYLWTCLRQMNSLYNLLDRRIQPPSLWLLRQDEAEAITVDYEYVRLWLSPTGCEASHFLRTALQKTEQLSMNNRITRLTAAAIGSQSALLQAEGYSLQKESPCLVLRL